VKVVLLLSLCFVVNSQRIPCGKEGLKRLDDRINKLFVLGDERKWPEDSSSMKVFCKDTKEHENAVKDYAKRCMNGLGKSIAQVVSYSIAKVSKQLCTVKRRRREFQKQGPCGNSDTKGTTRCMRGWNNAITIAKQYPDHKLKLPLVCCHFYIFKDCVLDVFTKVGSPTCTEKSNEFYEDVISRSAIDTLKLMCGDFADEGSDKCEGLLKKYEKLPKATTDWRSPLLPLMELLDTFPPA